VFLIETIILVVFNEVSKYIYAPQVTVISSYRFQVPEIYTSKTFTTTVTYVDEVGTYTQFV